MKDLSMHILDICENSIDAGAKLIEITIDEDTQKNILSLKIADNGKGLEESILKKVLDPFYTTRTTRRVGLGFPLLSQAAKEADGNIDIQSKKGEGTTVAATFVHNHIDRKPLGNIPETITTLIAGRGLEIDIVYNHCRDGCSFLLDTREIKKELQDVPINNPEILSFLQKYVEEGLNDIQKKAPEHNK